MNHDDTIWSTIGHNFCSFKVKTHQDKELFCRNPYNLTGMCSRHTCPLANQTYATVIEHEDELYLYIKTAERAHLPRRQWEKVKLNASFPKALEQIDEQLEWWDRRFVHRVKARLLRLKQYLLRKKKMLLEPQQEVVSVNKRQEFKLVRREEKAEMAARIELEIEKELLERLRRGTYDSVINVNQEAFEKMLDEQEDKDDLEKQELMEDEENADLDEEDEFIEDEEFDEEEEAEELPPQKLAGKRHGRGDKVVEFERENVRTKQRSRELEW